MGSPDGIATALTNLGDMRMALGEIASAKSAYQESLETFRKNGEKSKAAYPLVGMGDVYAASGDFADAKKSYDEALSISNESGEKHESAVAMANLGTVLMQQGDLTGARAKYQKAIDLRNEIGEKSGAAEISLQLASLALEEGRASEGKALAGKALEEIRAAKIPELQISAHAILADALLAQGKLDAARKEIAAGKPLAEKTQQRLVRMQFEIAAAEVQTASKKPADLQAATTTLNRVIGEAERSGVLATSYEARIVLGKTQVKYGNKEEGKSVLAAVQKDAAEKGFVLMSRKAGR
jgi:tetratricopeptide (TPR) repeat protein